MTIDVRVAFFGLERLLGIDSRRRIRASTSRVQASTAWCPTHANSWAVSRTSDIKTRMCHSCL